MTIRVYYEDVDIGGVVYYANYFKFIERARSNLFFMQNKNPFDVNGHFVVKNINADFVSSAKLGDKLLISTSLKSHTKASVTLEQIIQRDSMLLFKCEVTLVYVNSNNKPIKINDDLLQILKQSHSAP